MVVTHHRAATCVVDMLAGSCWNGDVEGLSSFAGSCWNCNVSSHYELFAHFGRVLLIMNSSTGNDDPPPSTMDLIKNDNVNVDISSSMIESKGQTSSSHYELLLPHRLSSSHYELSTGNIDPSSEVLLIQFHM
ncbi:hypothetical protein F3Y22_tig00110777pilonHSYRG00207 [Hibiscus syriacus]|uniref:Uncharacterized protein n=1 Tax=Hibiscus syriacus TaxID=106335 RepID=A0A6A2ZT04_HIBSY|nr:hypothetical protein F3Y22_tig00110777pilonHSYRG00207 [Hibiscus syriacus]